MDLVPRRPAKRSPRPKADLAKNMIDALAAVGFDDIPESLMPSEEDVEALLEALMYGVLDDYLDQIAAIVKIRRDMIAGVTNLVAQSLLNPGDRVQFNETAKPRYLVRAGRGRHRQGAGALCCSTRRAGGSLHQRRSQGTSASTQAAST